jgi:ATP-dependent Lhr-like helicase
MSATSIDQWFAEQGWKPLPFQKKTWKAYAAGKSGFVNAPTGSGKTYALWGGIIQEALAKPPKKGLQALWITPLKALAVEIQQSTQRMSQHFDPKWKVDLRTGDTPSAARAKQRKRPNFGLVTTPESLHLLLGSKEHKAYFSNLQCIVIDEWHELMGSKRGVQIELALAYLKSFLPQLKVWGISATIGNLDLAQEILLGADAEQAVRVVSLRKKTIKVKSLVPKNMERFPWRGHLGLHLLNEVVKVVERSRSTLVFTNTRAQCEIWFQRLLEAHPDWAGQMAMHHGSMNKETRLWVEEALQNDRLKLVVCTSSLDLGVDFSPVESCIQIGSPKGVGRFLQRAGRSGHQPGKASMIYFLPTHAMELIEALALQTAIEQQIIEDRIPYLNSYDVLIQFLMTLAVGDGFSPKALFPILQNTFCFQTLDPDTWQWCLNFIRQGSQSLENYDEYKKVTVDENDCYRVANRSIAMRHRMSIGTIVSDADLLVKYRKGGFIGTIEEWFVSKLIPGDVFTFGGKNLELIKIQNNQVLVKKSKAKKAKIPAWMGGRMSFSAHLSELLRNTFYQLETSNSLESKALAPVLTQQKKQSLLPRAEELLIETFPSREGYHAVFYPFEGYAIHMAMASIVSYRLSLLAPTSFSLAYNDYGFELVSDRPIDLEGLLDNNLLSATDVLEDLKTGINVSETARRKFRDIAVIGGLVFQGTPSQPIKSKHLQSSSQLFYEVFKDYEPENLLYQQALAETFDHGMEQGRLMQAFERMNTQEIRWVKTHQPTPFSFPLITDRLRAKMSSESVEDRIRKMYLQLEKDLSDGSTH